jgi:hypothetical protein
MTALVAVPKPCLKVVSDPLGIRLSVSAAERRNLEARVPCRISVPRPR